ncbi:Down syndrome critical region protein 3 [Histomonas meleagridis]|uniref:Down syndrome critical region protein 3-like n=1 Tax=Histomonas meleagridis TaxID=135588 RepID=UPI00355A9F3B|nr:Down syndrome critical region protein 3 [Histomonas meleagridis]KAH0799338.1 Down syndrome critical region protein 3-like [Histomonas meleagridis]
MTSKATFTFDKLSRTYFFNDKITCTCSIETTEPIRAKEISFNIFGVRTINPKGHGLSGYDSQIPHTPENTIYHSPIQHKFPNVIENGYNFSFEFTVPKGSKLTESVRGKYVSVDYFVELSIKRGVFSSDFTSSRTFFLIFPPAPLPKGEPVDVTMDEKDIIKGKAVKFHAKVHLKTNVISFTKPPRGYVIITGSESPILYCFTSYYRTETVKTDKSNPIIGHTEVGLIQIAESNPPFGIKLPISMEWIRFSIVPQIDTSLFGFKVDLKVTIYFEGGSKASKVIPLTLCRDLGY